LAKAESSLRGVKMEDNEEIVAVIFAAIQSYLSEKHILIKKVRKIGKICNHTDRWLMHTPQIFWRTRGE